MFDVIVVGCGGIGSATTYHLAKRGVKVLALERQATIAHQSGSSHGNTRIIRRAYFEGASYVPLLNRSYQLWHDLEQTSGEQLLRLHSLLHVGQDSESMMKGVLDSVRKHQIDIENLNENRFRELFPQLEFPAGATAVLERNAGILSVEKCVETHVRLAREAGAVVLTGVTVVDWQQAKDGSVLVRTADQQTLRAKKVIVAAGAWSSQLLPQVRVNLRPMRKHLHWFGGDVATTHADAGFPIFMFDLGEDGMFYGFPDVGNGVKVGEHGDGVVLSRDELKVSERGQGCGVQSEKDVARVKKFISKYLKTVDAQQHFKHQTCMYTMTDDEDFVVDFAPDAPSVVFAAGFSGHGFKFAPVMGEILADLALNGATKHDITFLSKKRFPKARL